jgi:hypothetical protein
MLGYVFINNDVTTTYGGPGALTIYTAAAAPIVFNTNTVERMRIDAVGNVTGTYGNYHVASDVRLKKDIKTIDNALGKVLQMRGVNFHWKDEKFDNGKLEIGMIAQEVEKVVPELVHTNKEGTKAIEYEFSTGLLVQAIKELKNVQQKEIDQLKAENAAQKLENMQIKKDLEALKAKVK